MMTYLWIMIICVMNITFTNSRTVSIKSRSYGYYLGCTRREICDWKCIVFGQTAFSYYKYEVDSRSSQTRACNDNFPDVTCWDVVNVGGDYIALKSTRWDKYLSAQSGVL